MNDAFICRGKINYDISKSEKPNIKFKRSIYVSKNLKKGDIISNANVKIVRPSYGLEPKYLSKILGKKIKRNISFGKPFKWSLIKD